MQWNEFRSHLRHLSVHQQSGVKEAFDLAKKMHEGQKRRSGEPYFMHPVAVALMLADMGADTDTIMTALLHDTVEDTPLTLEDVKKRFNNDIYTLIEGVTKLSKEDIADRPNLNEQHETLRRIFTLMDKDVRVMVIKIVDRLHNMQTAEFLPAEKQKNLARETIDVYVKIADRLCMQDVRDELEGLCLAILEPDTFMKLSALRGANEANAHDLLEVMRKALRKAYPGEAAAIDLHFEPKSWSNIREQLDAEGAVVTGVTAFTAAFLCDDIDACYGTLGLLHQLWPREALSFQDFINSPAVNGYRGLHTTVILRDGTRVRCKIRTREMHEYARKGIASRCFDRKESNLLNLLPWTERIAPLAQDTAGRSTEFWETLQSDILGESIMIYGPGDQAMPVPKDSTALDGAFYLLKDAALTLTSIRIAGKEVPYDTRLEPATTLQLTINDEPRVERKWLEWTRTGLATAKIREALVRGRSVAEKIPVGQELLQQVLSSKKKGFLEEFDEKKLEDRLKTIGMQSLRDAYIAIAEGKLDPLYAYKILFESAVKTGKAHGRSTTIRYAADLSNIRLMDNLGDIHRQYAGHFDEIRYKQTPNRDDDIVHLKVCLDDSDVDTLIKKLSAAGAKNIRSVTALRQYMSAIILLVLLWGLDSIFAKLLLDAGFNASALTVVRSWTSFVAASVIALFLLKKRSLNPIPLHFSSLWIAGVSFFALSLITYFMLESTSPFLYKTALRGSALLLGIAPLLRQRKYGKILAACILAAGAFFLLSLEHLPAENLWLAIATMTIFALYTWASEYFQKTAHIDMRYPQFFFVISAIAALLSLFLPLMSDLAIPSFRLLFLAIIFTLVFVCLPYILFYALSRVTDYVTLSPLFHGSIVITFLGQWLFLGINDVLLIPPVILLITASLLTHFSTSGLTKKILSGSFNFGRR